MTVEDVTVVGVPVISPVDESKDRPAGIVPAVIAHKFGAPAVYVGVAPLTGLFLVKVYGEPGYEIADGASSCTVIEIVVELLPAELVAVIVTEAVGYTAVGVPVRYPEAEGRTIPAGSVPLVTEYDVLEPPLLLGAVIK